MFNLARHAELGDEIPEKLYTAVAEVLAYVFQLKRIGLVVAYARCRRPTWRFRQTWTRIIHRRLLSRIKTACRLWRCLTPSFINQDSSPAYNVADVDKRALLRD
jgi:hypothetical protein